MDSPRDHAEAVIGAAEAKLDARGSAREVMALLATLRLADLPADLKGRYLLARGIGRNRCGDARAALEDLLEAQKIFATLGDTERLSSAAREQGVVHSWRGAGREAGFALIRALAESASAASPKLTARALVEAARANIEIGHPQESIPLLEIALKTAGADLTALERGRAEMMLIKAMIDHDDVDAADARLRQLDRKGIGRREAYLAELEEVRILLRRKRLKDAERRIKEIESVVPGDANSFEHAEYLASLCEVQLALGHGAAALATVDEVIPKVRGDDLGAPLVSALSQRARALDLMGKKEDAADAAASALRRAAERQLQREADALREQLILRGETARALAGLSKGHIDARFIRCNVVGEGGFGEVRRAYDRETGEEVALKKVKVAAIYDRKTRQQKFETAEGEVEGPRRIVNPGVARVLGVFYEADGDIFIASEFVRGPSLRQAITEGTAPGDWAALVAKIAQALDAVHAAKIVHGDVKPENVILKPENVILKKEGGPVLVDFGSASFSSRTRKFRPGSFTRAYAAPEQQWRLPVGPRADIFALGGVAYELICGKRLRATSDPRVMFDVARCARIVAELLKHGLSPTRARLIARCLSLIPARRPTAREVAEALLAPAQEAAPNAKLGAAYATLQTQ